MHSTVYTRCTVIYYNYTQLGVRKFSVPRVQNTIDHVGGQLTRNRHSTAIAAAHNIIVGDDIVFEITRTTTITCSKTRVFSCACRL